MSLEFAKVIQDIYRKLAIKHHESDKSEAGSLSSELGAKINALLEADEKLAGIKTTLESHNLKTDFLNSFYKGIAEVQISSLRNVKTIYELNEEIKNLKSLIEIIGKKMNSLIPVLDNRPENPQPARPAASVRTAARTPVVPQQEEETKSQHSPLPTSMVSQRPSSSSNMPQPQPSFDLDAIIGDILSANPIHNISDTEELKTKIINMFISLVSKLGDNDNYSLKSLKTVDELKIALKKIGAIYFVDPLVYLYELLFKLDISQGDLFKILFQSIATKSSIGSFENFLNMFFIQLTQDEFNYILQLEFPRVNELITKETQIYKSRKVADGENYVSIITIIHIINKTEWNKLVKNDTYATNLYKILGKIVGVFSMIPPIYNALKSQNTNIIEYYNRTFKKYKKIFPYLLIWHNTSNRHTLFKLKDKEGPTPQKYLTMKHNKSHQQQDVHYFGPYEEIFFNSPNSQMAKSLIELDSLKEMFEKQSNPLCFVSFGKSGSGKTSSLLYLKKEDGSSHKGVILEIFNTYKANISNIKVTYRDLKVHLQDASVPQVIVSEAEKAQGIGKSGNIKYKLSTYKNLAGTEIIKIYETSKLDVMGQDILDLMSSNTRATYPTPNNIESSRSHLIICFEITLKSSVKSKIVVCDLAGFENEFDCDALQENMNFEDAYREAYKQNKRTKDVGLDLEKCKLHDGLKRYFIGSDTKVMDNVHSYLGMLKGYNMTVNGEQSKGAISLWKWYYDKSVGVNKDYLWEYKDGTYMIVISGITWENFKKTLEKGLSIKLDDAFPIQSERDMREAKYPKLTAFLKKIFNEENKEIIAKIMEDHELLPCYTANVKFLTKECEERVQEGRFINESLIEFSRDIKDIVSSTAGNVGEVSTFPYLKHLTKDSWESFFHQKNSDTDYGAIARAIHCVVENIGKPMNETNASVKKTMSDLKWITWSVVNLSDTVQHKIPYVNIDKIVYEYEINNDESKLRQDLLAKINSEDYYKPFMDMLNKSKTEMIARFINRTNASTVIGSLAQGTSIEQSRVNPKLGLHQNSYLGNSPSKIGKLDLLSTPDGTLIQTFNAFQKYLKYKLKYLELKKQLKR